MSSLESRGNSLDSDKGLSRFSMSITPLKFDGPMLLIFLSAKNTEETVLIESFSKYSLAIILNNNNTNNQENNNNNNDKN